MLEGGTKDEMQMLEVEPAAHHHHYHDVRRVSVAGRVGGNLVHRKLHDLRSSFERG